MERVSTINRPFILNIYKPPGIGSTQVVGKIKRALGKSIKKVGHFGTLDPFAEGVLLIGANGACRLNDYLHERYPKTYLATGKLGQKTNTGDLEGEVIEEKPTPEIDLAKAEEVLKSFIGEYWQVPPSFSATKHQGKALYQWAREGVQVKKDAVKREIQSIELVEWSSEFFKFRVTATTGTYIRTLFEDISERLGSTGHLIALKREAIGPMSFEKSLHDEQWPGAENFNHDSFLTLQECFDVPEIKVSGNELKLYSHGNPVDLSRITHSEKLSEGDMLWVSDSEGVLLGLASVEAQMVTSCFNFPYTPR
ncbi:MAG: tRNA pseudouridine(55) synthase TruB [Deltaproteobacteria bacterium]|nr:MAG: tRNA pseudouridine(55) synthase TruB [Deltaproteobacteria bacterium]